MVDGYRGDPVGSGQGGNAVADREEAGAEAKTAVGLYMAKGMKVSAARAASLASSLA